MRSIYTILAILLIAVFTLLSSCCEDCNCDCTPPPESTDWSQLPNVVLTRLNDVFFVDSNYGWIVGYDEVILTTSNGGDGWVLAPPSPPREEFISVMFVNRLQGWMAGDFDGNPAGGQVAYSGIGGPNPEEQVTTSDPLNVVFMVDEFNGWTGGQNGTILNTTDAGQNWMEIDFPSNFEIFDVHFLSANSGWVCTANGEIYGTSDGSNWTEQDISTTSDIRAIYFVDETHGWACGDGNTVFRVTEGVGATLTWTAVSLSDESEDQVWNDIFFVDEMNGWIVGENGKIYHSSDGGSTWMIEKTGLENTINAIHMIDNSTGYVVGRGGLVMRYTPQN